MVEWTQTLASYGELGDFMQFITGMEGHLGNEVTQKDGKPHVTVWVRETGETMQQQMQKMYAASWKGRGDTGGEGSGSRER